MMSEIHESLGELKAKTKAAHERIDKLEVGLREDLKEIANKLDAISAWMHTKKGHDAAMLAFAGVIGGAASILLNYFLKH